MKRDAPANEIDLGTLSVSEEALTESATHRALRESLQDQHYEAQQMRLWHEHELQRRIDARVVPEWDMVRAFANWSAREHCLRHKIEAMGWQV